MDIPADSSGQKNRTTKEQSYIENMIIKVYDQYRDFCLHEQESEDNVQEDEFKKLVTHYLVKDYHGQFLYLHLHNVGKSNLIYLTIRWLGKTFR